ncbi:MAG: tetratricopeptide repeat protein [Candidatus Hermodarchaeota archaeon]
MTLPSKLTKIINKIPEKYAVLRKILEKNYQLLNLDELESLVLKKKKFTIKLYTSIVVNVLSSNSEALELLKYLGVLDTKIETNIDRKSVEKAYKIENIQNKLDFLIQAGFLVSKETQENFLDFASEHVQNSMLSISDKTCHEKAIQYYETKSDYFKEDYHNVTEILRHQSEIAIDNELAIKFLGVCGTMQNIGLGIQEMIVLGEKLINLEDKYKAPILVALGNLYAVSGRNEDAENAYLEALKSYNKLAKSYYKVYLPYVATVHNHLGKLYADLKRFEESEKIYLKTLELYKELERKYNDVFLSDEDDLTLEGKPEELVNNNVDIDLPIDLDPERLCQEAFEDYRDVVKEYHDIYLPDINKTQEEIGHVYIDLELLGEHKGTILDEPTLKKLYAKTCYDDHLADVATVYHNLGLTYEGMLQFDKAEKMYLDALRIRDKLAEQYPDRYLSNLAIVQNSLAVLYFYLYREQDAEEMYLELLNTKKDLSQRNPSMYLVDYVISINNIGNFYYNLHHYDKAEKMYLESLKLFEGLPKKEQKIHTIDLVIIQNNVGNVNMSLNNFDKAKLHFDKALKIDPDNSDVIYNYACLEALNKNTEKAMEYLKKACKADDKFKKWAKTDPFLVNLKNLPEFKKLIGENNKGQNKENKP